jgi:hypothetical protein
LLFCDYRELFRLSDNRENYLSSVKHYFISDRQGDEEQERSNIQRGKRGRDIAGRNRGERESRERWERKREELEMIDI